MNIAAHRELANLRVPDALVPVARAARTRRALVVFAFALPWVVAIAAIASRAGTAATIAAAVVAALAAIALVVVAMRRVDAATLARRLDAGYRDLDDSVALTFDESIATTPLARLQRERVIERIVASRYDVREPWPRRALGISAAIAAVVIVLAVLWPPAATLRAHDPMSDAARADTAATTTAIESIAIDVAPPAYTGLAARTESTPDLRVESGATVRWRLQFAARPDTVTLIFHDKSRLVLEREGDTWQGERGVETAALYRIELTGVPPLADDRLRRLDVIPDRAPEIRVLAPDRTLSMIEPGQATWPLSFEVADDYGLADATLAITLAQGSGENIEVKESSLVLTGEGDARSQRYAHTVDLQALGLASGDDVIVRLVVRDNRAPAANEARTAGYILRWPPERGEDGEGIEGMLRTTLPAYFRSQRQIIIDTEKLIPQRPALSEEALFIASDTIGVDQRLLRLRYGQFLGEEANEIASVGKHSDAEGAHAEGEAHGDGDAAGGGAMESGGAPTSFGNAGDAMGAFGHTHDESEAATLLDPETRKLLRAALGEMWQAELHLRSSEPEEALPYEYRALGYIKQVQQASRIYLARVGLELPPIDATRRLTGDLEKAAPGASALMPKRIDDAAAVAAWQALSIGADPQWPALDDFIATLDTSDPRTLAFLAAVDRVRREAGCGDCRAAAADALWPLIEQPAAQSAPRAVPDAAARAYLRALEGAQP